MKPAQPNGGIPDTSPTNNLIFSSGVAQGLSEKKRLEAIEGYRLKQALDQSSIQPVVSHTAKKVFKKKGNQIFVKRTN